MTRQQAVQRLYTVWLTSLVLLTILISIQSASGKYGDDYPIAISWLLALHVPAVSILTVAVFTDSSNSWRTAVANRFRYRWAFWGSLLLVVCAVATVAGEPLLTMTPFDLFNLSSIGLTIVQGIVLSAVGAVVFDGR